MLSVLHALFTIVMQTFSRGSLEPLTNLLSFLIYLCGDHDNTGFALIGKSIAIPSPLELR